MDESRGREGGRFAGTNPCATSIKIETRLSLSIRHEPRSSADSFWIVLRAIRSFPWPKDAPWTMIMRDDRFRRCRPRGCYFARTFERRFRVLIAAPMNRTEATVVATDFVSSNEEARECWRRETKEPIERETPNNEGSLFSRSAWK